MLKFLKWTAPVVIIACGGKNPGSYQVGEGGGTADANVVGEADALWVDREDKAKLEAALAKYEEAYAADPTNRHVAVRLTGATTSWVTPTNQKWTPKEHTGKPPSNGAKSVWPSMTNSRPC